MTLAHCRSCGAPVIWVVTTNGKRMPVDADPLMVARGFRLQEETTDAGGTSTATVVATFTAAPVPDERLWVSHFSTCPQASQHRRIR